MKVTLVSGVALAALLGANAALAQNLAQAQTDAPKVTSDPLSLNGPSVKPKTPIKPQAKTPAETTGQVVQSDSSKSADSKPAAKPAAASIRLGTDSAGRVAVNKDQERQIASALRKMNVRPVQGVDVPAKIGAVVPDAVRLGAVSADLVAVLPQFRGYSYFATRDDIVMVDPRGRKIVAFLPAKPVATATRPAPARVSTTARPVRSTATRVAPGPEVIQRDVTVGSGVVEPAPVVVEETTYPAVPGYPSETVRETIGTAEPVVTTGTVMQGPVRQRRVIQIDPD